MTIGCARPDVQWQLPNAGDPRPGEALFFAADGRDLVTSPLERVDRPAKALVDAYPEPPQPPPPSRHA